MSSRNYYLTSGLCVTCKKERAYTPPPEIAYDIGLCQSMYIEGPWPFFAPDDERKGSSQQKQRVALAKSICSVCPCRQECKAWALAQDNNLHGIWGGTTRSERTRLRASRRREEVDALWRERYGEVAI